MRPDLPTGTVTFLFTDVEGSTRLLQELGPEGYADALAEHRRIVRDAFSAHGGVEVDTQGDAFFVAFPTAHGALAAAAAACDALAAGPIRVRMGIHTGTPHMSDEGYIGPDVHRGARIAAAGHGGQVLVSAATAAVVGTDGLRELGEHRLKDFAEPVVIYELGDERFPPLKTISNTNLPRPASSFIGRETEVAAVATLLQDGARLLTLTGPGGSGKTRLAIEAAASLVPEFKAGVFWVGLAPVRDPALVSQTIGQTLGAKDGLADHIGEREMLLLVDNLEQVIAAAPDLAGLVENCPNLRLLVTSRERLRVRGEVEYPVAPLVDPEAVDLFCARAQTQPDEPIRRLCRALDNLPLAIELAAARESVLTPAQILERLSGRLDLLKGGRDADPRQQTLRATIEWSFELLTPDEQRLFARMAVFVGGATLEAAEHVAEADLDTLQSLVDRSLVRRTGERFWMLETIREFAVERLAASGEADELRRRFAEHFLALAEEAFPHLEPEVLMGGHAWIDRLESEVDNLREALDHFANVGAAESWLRLAGALPDFWIARGHTLEGLGRISRALDANPAPSAARARALIGATDLAEVSGEHSRRARLWADEALALQRELGDPRGIAKAVFRVGVGAVVDGDWERATELLNQSLAEFRENGDLYFVPWITRTLAWTRAQSGDLAGARELYEEGLSAAREIGSSSAEAALLGSLGWLAGKEGRPLDALTLYYQSLALKRDVGDLGEIAIGLAGSALALARVGDSASAARLLGSAATLGQEVGIGEAWVVRDREEALELVRAQLHETAFSEAWEEGARLALDEAVDLALDYLSRGAEKSG
ncbi:MAG TPA: adenylate/guanylate cyclase domain-containing protein [Candidatus Limnocylindria bacterium]